MKIAIHNKSRLYDYNFEVANSGIIGVYGISGSGKSSLLDAIAGYDEQSSGLIEFNGKQFSSVIQCAYMNQHPTLFDHWTIKENLDFVKKYHNIAYDQYIQKLDCSELLNKYPRQLSGGEKQRIAFIRTLIQIHDDSLALLDEPFSALDKPIRKIALSLLIQQSNKALIFLVTHEIKELYQIADEFLYIHNGAINYHSNICDAMKCGFNDLPIASRIMIENNEHVIYADDVSISQQRNSTSSIQHQISCTIESINTNKDIPLIKLTTKDKQQTLYAKITQESLIRLKLSPNQRIIASFKALAYHD